MPPICAIPFIRQNLQKWGHTGLVWDNSGGTKSFTILEQNFDSKANSPAKLREDDYTGLTHFIVPTSQTIALI